MARAIVRLLRLMDMSPRHFCSAEDLLASRDGGIGCYVIDVQLPGMSGLDLRRRLLAHAPSLPVVLITARDDLDSPPSPAAPGVLLVKPFTGRRLAEAVRSVAMGA